MAVGFRWRKWGSGGGGFAGAGAVFQAAGGGDDEFGQGGGVYGEAVEVAQGGEELGHGHDGGVAGDGLGGFAAVGVYADEPAAADQAGRGLFLLAQLRFHAVEFRNVGFLERRRLSAGEAHDQEGAAVAGDAVARQRAACGVCVFTRRKIAGSEFSRACKVPNCSQHIIVVLAENSGNVLAGGDGAAADQGDIGMSLRDCAGSKLSHETLLDESLMTSRKRYQAQPRGGREADNRVKSAGSFPLAGVVWLPPSRP